MIFFIFRTSHQKLGVGGRGKLSALFSDLPHGNEEVSWGNSGSCRQAGYQADFWGSGAAWETAPQGKLKMSFTTTTPIGYGFMLFSLHNIKINIVKVILKESDFTFVYWESHEKWVERAVQLCIKNILN